MEHAFSSSGITATTHRNKLSPQTFESLQILKSAYRNVHVAAAEQAVAHLKTLWETDDVVDISDSGF